MTALVLLVPPAYGRPAEVEDPRDTRGPLDLRWVQLRGTHKARFTMKSEATWTSRRLQDRGFLLVHLDTFGTPHFDHFALVRSLGRGLEGSLWRSRRDHDPRLLRRIPARHSGPRSAFVAVPLRALTLRRSHFRWWVQTLWNGWPCHRTCFDRAPNRGAKLRLLGVP